MVLEVLRALGRRWYVVVAGLLVTGALTYGALTTTPPEYNARGLVLLLPSDAAVGKGGNPFLQLSGLEQPAGILVASFSSAPARADVADRSPTADYTIGIDDSTRGPVIAVDVTAASEKETMDTLSYLVSRIPQELARLQTQVEAPDDAAVRSMPLTVDEKPEVSRAGTIRMMIAALVVGLVGTGAAGYAMDALMQRRRLRASGPLEPESEDDVQPQRDSRGSRRRRSARRTESRSTDEPRSTDVQTPPPPQPESHPEPTDESESDSESHEPLPVGRGR